MLQIYDEIRKRSYIINKKCQKMHKLAALMEQQSIRGNDRKVQSKIVYDAGQFITIFRFYYSMTMKNNVKETLFFISLFSIKHPFWFTKTFKLLVNDFLKFFRFYSFFNIFYKFFV
jgi:hypothetical protein